MNQPLFKPGTWVLFEANTSEGLRGGFGQVLGGIFDGTQWRYTVGGAHMDGTPDLVKEGEITQTLQNGSWLANSSTASGTSAYQE